MKKSSLVQLSTAIATASDFRADAEQMSWSEPEPVRLPHSKRVVVLRKPTKFYESLRRLGWPEELRAKVDAADSSAELAKQLTAAETTVILADRPKMVAAAFVEPKISLAAGPDQFSLDLLHDDDQAFILKYLRGQVDAKGVDLEAFRKSQSGPAGNGGADGQPLPGSDPA
jgi:hypothetical protein